MGQLKDAILGAPRFRPTEPTLASDFDQMVAGLLESLLGLVAFGAVDERATAVAVELAQQRKDAALKREQIRQDAIVAAASARPPATVLQFAGVR